MKRLLALMLALTLVLPSLALGDASRAVITIDGVRAAFFSADNTYLPPIDADGLLWVPVLPLSESLGLDVTADPDTLAITVNGVRAALFGEDNAYISPRLENGEVYVPLTAFCASAGVSLTVEGDSYALTRASSGVTAQQVVYVTPEPAPQYTAVPQYVYIQLSKDNFSRFFQIESSYTSSKDYKQYPYIINYTVSCYPTVALDASNVSISVKVGGVTSYMTLNSSGNGTDSVRETFYPEGDAIDRITAVGSKLTSLILSGYSLNSVSGRIRVSWDQACEYYDPTYNRAVKLMDTDPAAAAELFSTLAKAEWRDSAELVKTARANIDRVAHDQGKAALDKKDYDQAISLLQGLAAKGFEDSAELLAQAEEGRNAQAYAAADKLLAEGKWDEAEEAFTALGTYSDSAQKVDDARDGRNAENYAAAEKLLAEGRYDAAINAFASLKSLGYRDSADRLAEAQEARNAADYAAAEQLLAEGRYDAAIQAFTSLKNLGYRDSADRLAEAQEARNAADYAAAEQLLAEEKFDEAIRAFQALNAKGYSDSGDRVMEAERAREAWRDAAYGADYEKGLAALKKNDFSAAVEALGAPAAAKYKESAENLALAQKAAGVLSDWSGQYARGLTLEKKEDWAGALTAFESCLSFRNAQAHAAYCLLKQGCEWMTAPYSGAVFFKRNGHYGLANYKTGKYRYLSITEVSSTVLWDKGVVYVRKDGKFGVLDATGKWIVKAQYTNYRTLDGKILALYDASGWHLFSLKGKELGGQVFKQEPVILVSGKYTTATAKDVPCVVTSAGKVTTMRKGAVAYADTDGSIWYVTTSGSKQSIYNAKGRVQLTAKRIGTPSSYTMSSTSDERYKVCGGVVGYSEDGSTWGLYDLNQGKTLVRPAWTFLSAFTKDGVLRFSQGGKYGIATAAGRTLVGAKYTRLDYFYNGMSRAGVMSSLKDRYGKATQTTAYGFVNAQGREVVPTRYHDAGTFLEDPDHSWVRTIVGVFSGNRSLQRFGYLIVDKNGKTVQQIEAKDEDIITCKAVAPGFFFTGRRYDNYLHTTTGKSWRVGGSDTLLAIGGGTGVVIGTISSGKTSHTVTAFTDSKSKELGKLSGSKDITRVGPVVSGNFALQLDNHTALYTKKLYSLNLTKPESVTENSAADLRAVRSAAEE